MLPKIWCHGILKRAQVGAHFGQFRYGLACREEVDQMVGLSWKPFITSNMFAFSFCHTTLVGLWITDLCGLIHWSTTHFYSWPQRMCSADRLQLKRTNSLTNVLQRCPHADLGNIKGIQLLCKVMNVHSLQSYLWEIVRSTLVDKAQPSGVLREGIHYTPVAQKVF